MTLSKGSRASRGAGAIFLSLILALAYSLFIYYFNTPIGPSIGSDNAMYLTMGTAIAEGWAPYRDIFDHKGPLLFLLQGAAQLFGGGYSTLSIFVMEVLFLFACLRLCAMIARATGAPQLAVQLVYLALTANITGGGNLSEEYTNLFTLVGVLCALRVFDRACRTDGWRLLLQAAVMGAMAALSFLTRANNALPLCAMTLVLAAGLLIGKRFSQLGLCAGGFVLGLAAAALPIVLWLAHHGVIADAIYGAITHNLMYAETGGASRLHALLRTSYGHTAILIAAVACAGALTRIRKNPMLALSMIAAAGAAGLAAFISHKFYQHYLMIGVPMAAAGAAMLLAALKNAPRRVNQAAQALCALICCAWLVVCSVQANGYRVRARADLDAFTEDAQALYALVPEEERDSFMAYRVEPRWYAVTEAMPSMRFYFLQEILAQSDPAVMDEIVETFHAEPPEWLVIYYNREFGPPYDARVAELFETAYEFVDSRGTYQLRRLIH